MFGNKTIASAMPHPRFIVQTHIRTDEVLGRVLDHPMGDVDDESPPTATDNRSDYWDGQVTPTADNLDFSHVLQAFRESLRNMLLRYDSMWDGRIGEISFVKQRIDLDPPEGTHMQRPFRTDPDYRKFGSNEVQRMIEQGIIEPSQSEWALPVVVSTKYDGSLRFCVDFRELNAMIIRDTYPLPRMDECIDSLGDDTVFSSLDANWGY